MFNLVSLSSAEAELYGVVRASSEALGCQSLTRDIGCIRSIRVYADASASLGIAHRKGLGKVQHLDTSTLWVQQAAYSMIISYDKVLGTLNPSDIMTKHLAEPLSGQKAGLVRHQDSARGQPSLWRGELLRVHLGCEQCLPL